MEIPKNDPDTYARMSAPYETEEEAQAALSRFHEMVYEARLTCRIPDVIVASMAFTREHVLPSFLTVGDRGKIHVLGRVAMMQVSTLHAEALRDEAARLNDQADALDDEVDQMEAAARKEVSEGKANE